MSLQLKTAAASIPFLAHLSKEVLDKMNDAMFEVLAEPGDVLIQQGDRGDNLYLVESGDYAASRCSGYSQGLDDRSASSKALRMYFASQSFGERALMQNMPRAATVKCQKAGRLWALDRLSFRRIIMGETVTGLSALTDGDDDEPEEPNGAKEANGAAAEPQAGHSNKAAKLWQKSSSSQRVASFLLQSFEEKKTRKELRMSPKLISVFSELWDACGEDHGLMQEAYLDYHLCLSRGVADLTGDTSEFDAVDAFDAALEDWERDTKQGKVYAPRARTHPRSHTHTLALYSSTCTL